MIIIDTSAFISLATADSVEMVLEEYDVQTTETILEELVETAEYDDVHGRAATAVLELKHEYTIHATSEPALETSRVDSGEASCVTLCRELSADFLIIDDLRALPELQNLTDAQVAISPIMLNALVKRNRLTEREAKRRVETLAENRDWLESPIYRRAQDLFSA
ncbi:hypothetical protein G6M89_20435 [Natronolimnobius sp. AArcel1]|uniref:hypothetical protein n=1 Tax=Natronolimnobius sp. AArcel1 TaxID=1679093 RepID=UPI0013EA75C0|nr:hypothetical protein [Natronolimnobius sp. AArcel1]NGM71337.1 hypothetical protein [Natronolimnobius sp. AArcel1]